MLAKYKLDSIPILKQCKQPQKQRPPNQKKNPYCKQKQISKTRLDPVSTSANHPI